MKILKRLNGVQCAKKHIHFFCCFQMPCSFHIPKSVFVVFALPNIIHFFLSLCFLPFVVVSPCSPFIAFAERRKTLFAKFLSTFVWAFFSFLFFFLLLVSWQFLFSTQTSKWNTPCIRLMIIIWIFFPSAFEQNFSDSNWSHCSRERKSALSDKRYY